MRFYDYIFYRVASYYIFRWKEEIGGPMKAMILVALIQSMHIMLFAIMVGLVFQTFNATFFLSNRNMYQNPHALILTILIFGPNFYRYLKVKPYEQIAAKENWKDEPINVKRRKGYLIVLYIILTLTITFAAAIYRAAHYS